MLFGMAEALTIPENAFDKPQKHFKTFSKLKILLKAKALKTLVIAVVLNF